jgi:hypothetical protein
MYAVACAHTLSILLCVALQIGPQPFSWDAWARPKDLKTRKLPPNPRKHLFRNKYQQQQQPSEAHLRWEQQAYPRQGAQQARPWPTQAQPPRGVQMHQQAKLPQGAQQPLQAQSWHQVHPPQAVNLRPRQVQLPLQLRQQAWPPRGVHLWPRQVQISEQAQPPQLTQQPWSRAQPPHGPCPQPDQAQPPLASPGKRQRLNADQAGDEKMTSPEVRLPLPVQSIATYACANQVCPHQSSLSAYTREPREGHIVHAESEAARWRGPQAPAGQ